MSIFYILSENDSLSNFMILENVKKYSIIANSGEISMFCFIGKKGQKSSILGQKWYF